jgi:hypothetical protein
MLDVGLDFEDLTWVCGGVATQIFPVVGNTPVVLLLLLTTFSASAGFEIQDTGRSQAS